MQAMTATLARHLNEQGGYRIQFFHHITTGISSHVCYPLEECPVALFKDGAHYCYCAHFLRMSR